jgi:hypothetical protein
MTTKVQRSDPGKNIELAVLLFKDCTISSQSIQTGANPTITGYNTSVVKLSRATYLYHRAFFEIFGFPQRPISQSDILYRMPQFSLIGSILFL